ncbi:MAG: SH3 domain-containing protein, partial [Anaerolineae bacterium]|nr:SH3 domain-containing protein [Anaerolineae bacterium]
SDTPPENGATDNRNEAVAVATAVPPTSTTERPTATPENSTATAALETAVGDVGEEEARCTLVQSVNLFSGPGLSFPPLRELSLDEALTPLAFTALGFPDGQWLEVVVAETGEQGWVSAGAAFINCNIDPASLPPSVNIPPTPTVEPTDTPEVVTLAQEGPPRITNNVPGGTKAEYVIDEVIVDDAFLFRIAITDTRFGQQDGAGIHHADFTISSLDSGQIIYENREDHAAYCVFQGGLPDCNPWWEDNGRFFWPNGVEVQPGGYHATILVYPQHPAFQDEVWNWDFDFWIELP